MKKSKRLLTSLIVTACLVLMAFPASAAADGVVYGKVTKMGEKEVTIGTLNLTLQDSISFTGSISWVLE